MKAVPIDVGLRVEQVTTPGSVSAWNERCCQTFAKDAIKEGDVVVSVNGIGVNTAAIDNEEKFRPMQEEFYRAHEFFLKMRRAAY